MTTIAWDGHTLAADSLQSSDGNALWHRLKVHKFSNGAVCGTAGIASYRQVFIDWYEAGADQKSKPTITGDFSALVAMADGNAIKFEEDLLPILVPAGHYVAIGSGWHWALASMDHGKSAVLAVEYAITRDLYSGGPVSFLQPDHKTELT